MTTESAAVFSARALEVGISQAHLDALVREGFSTLGAYAFSCAYTPGSPDDAPLVALVTRVLAGVPTAAVLAGFRRLCFEAYTFAAAEIKGKVERTDESAPKRLPHI